MTELCVIGCGNMGSALLQGLAAVEEYELTAIDSDPQALKRVSADVSKTTEHASAAMEAQIVFLSVKPEAIDSVLSELELSEEQTLVTLAAGVSRDYVADRTDATVVRVMPNIAARHGSMAAAAVKAGLTDEVAEILRQVGMFVEVDESLIDISTAVNGGGPAFAFYLIDAVKQAGVENGLDPEQSERLAAQTFKGASETILQDDRDIEELIDAVCSPNGTTIEGMEILWESSTYETVREAVKAAERRSNELAGAVGDG
jgi:pyrroline-5-carboxylate reductase